MNRILSRCFKSRMVCALSHANLAKTLSMFLCASILAIPFASAVDRIGIRIKGGKTQFYNTSTGGGFQPIGFNHTLVKKVNGTVYNHLLFTPQYYDASGLTVFLDSMQDYGYNTVRIFHCVYNGSNGAPVGIAGDSGNMTGLSTVYMDNYEAFLQMAKARNIYVVQTIPHAPFTSHYNAIRDSYSNSGDFDGVNMNWGREGELQRRKALWENVMQDIKSRDSSLMNTILVNMVANEFTAQSDALPYTMTSGSVTGLNGNSYNMGLDSERQALFDDSTVYYTDFLGDAIKGVHSSALVGIGMWLYWGDTDESPSMPFPNGMRDTSGYYTKHPALPAPLMNATGSGANGYEVVDIHYYPYGDQPLEQKLEASSVGDADLGNGKVLFAGEYGALKDNFPESNWDASHVATDFHAIRYDVLAGDYGVSGFLWWAYNNYGFASDIWLGGSGNAEILAKMNPKEFAGFPGPYAFEDDFDDMNANGWSFSSGSDFQVIDWALEQFKTGATHMATINSYSDGEFDLQLDMTVRKNSGWAGVHFRKTNSNDGFTASGYTAFVDKQKNVSLYKAGTGVIAAAATGVPYMDRQLSMKIRARGQKLKIWINGNLKIDITDSAYTSAGAISLVSNKTRVRFDNVQISE